MSKIGKAEDISGQKFNKLTALNYLGNSIWECQCECGNKRNVKASYLRLNRIVSCGKCNKLPSKLVDLTGQKFNEWTVLEYAGNSMWKCKCSCGKEKLVHGYDLKNNSSKSCGHNTLGTNFEDLTGQQFNEWRVLSYTGNKKWLCQCSCGVEKEVYTKHLKSGASKSCGHSQVYNMIGQQFGDLTIKEHIEDSKWLCECTCGNTTIVEASNLLSGRTSSCGCKSASIPKYTYEQIISILNDETANKERKLYIEEFIDIFKISQSTAYKYIETYDLQTYINYESRSKYERQLCEILDSLEVNYILHNRQIIQGQELDIYIPEKKLAIEFNGDYWHSSIYKDKKYHQNKTIACAKQGIRLLHIFEYEWLDTIKRDKIIKLIKRIVSNNKECAKIYARNTYIKEISYTESKQFLDLYHLQNNTQAYIYLGCFHSKTNKLLGVITLGNPRFNDNYEYEIVRLCWNPNFIVIGGTEKLFTYFVRNYNPNSIITYVDISKFTGNVYTRLGFKVIDKNYLTTPNYMWVNLSTHKALPRYKTMKHKLIKQGLGNKEQTENEIMSDLGYVKVYSSGNLKMHWEKI